MTGLYLLCILAASLIVSNVEAQTCSEKNTQSSSDNGCAPWAPCCSNSGFCGYTDAHCGRGQGKDPPEQYKPKAYRARCYQGDTCEFDYVCRAKDLYSTARYCLNE